jgi:GTP-binding protein EngB required for normal cell division
MQKNDIISKLSIDSLPPEKQEKIINRLENLIQRKVSLKIAELMIDQDIPSTATDAETLTLLKNKIPDFDAIIKTIATETVDTFIEKIN